MADFVSGMNQGLSTARNMIYGDQQAKDETSILSSRAQEQKLALHEHQQSYAAKMAIYSSEKDFARENNNIDIMTNQGIDKMYEDLQNRPNIRSNPEAMVQLLDLKNKNKLQMQQAEKANKDIEIEQTQVTHDKANIAIGDPSNPTGWTEAIESAKTPALKQLLQHGQSFFTSPEYLHMNADKQALEQRKFLGHITSGNQVATAANGIAATIIHTGEAATKKSNVDSEIRDRTIKEQQAQQRINIEKKKTDAATEKHAGDVRKNIDALKKQHADAVDKIEKEQRAILVTAGITTSEDLKSSWLGFVKNSVLSPSVKAKYQELELQKIRRQVNLAEGLRQYDKDTKATDSKSPDSIAQTVVKHGWSYEPDKYEYRLGPDGKPQRKVKE